MTEPKSVVEYGQKCLLCRWDAATSRVLCWRHIDEIRDMLDVENHGNVKYNLPASIPSLFASLDSMPSSGGLDGGRRAPGFESMPPLNLHVVALRDPRTLPSGDDPVRSIPGAMHAILAAIRADLGYEPPALTREAGGVVTPCLWLSGHLEAVTRLPWVDDLYRDLRHLRDALRAAHGEQLPRPVGHCTNVVDGQTCGHPLYPSLRVHGVMTAATVEYPPIHCGQCHAKYGGLAQLRLEVQERKREGR